MAEEEETFLAQMDAHCLEIVDGDTKWDVADESDGTIERPVPRCSEISAPPP